MKKHFLLIVTLLCSIPVWASHISGGELFYEYLGAGASANSSKYRITMRLFRDCTSSGQELSSESVTIGIYNTNDRSLVQSLALPLQLPINSIRLNTSAIPCITNAPNVCFQIGIFTTTVDLPNTPSGYTLSWIRCCRADNLANLTQSSGVGATFSTSIPGTMQMPTGHNNSPQFLVKDTALVCRNKNFFLDFGATDADGDSLSYAFCDAFEGGTSSAPNPGPSPVLTLNALPYRTPQFSGVRPLGNTVDIDPRTGLISGVAPAAGRYVINVCVTERRNGVILNIHRKDFILAIGNCDFAAATPVPLTGQPYTTSLPYKYLSCAGFTVDFTNQNNSSTIQSVLWDFGVQGITTDTSTSRNPTFIFPDTGIYRVKLIVRASAGCVDSNTTIVGIYPGFTADFTFNGSCFQAPFQFQDQTFVRYGTQNSWSWNFGEPNINTDTSTLKNPSYQYPTAGTKNVRLITTSTVGCSDTIAKPVLVRDAPELKLPFKDTVICSVDSLRLQAVGVGLFSWTPAYNIINANTATPIVYPKDTVFYVVSLDDAGCVSRDSVRINVVDSVTIYTGLDTTICRTDDVKLNVRSNATGFTWSPARFVIANSSSAQPIVRPDTTTTFRVIATIGKCLANDSLRVKVVPYPVANAGNNLNLCAPEKGQIQASIVGSSFTWTPQVWLSNPSVLNPIVSAAQSISYILTVSDTIGCPKVGRDTVMVNVIPKVKAFAGFDTMIVAGQPLQLQASGGTSYSWSPSLGLDSPFSANPIANLGANIDSITYRVRVSTPEGCFGVDDIKVIVFKTMPDLFIPSAFTPNADGRNDVLKPIAVGIRDLAYFRVFNRWGQLVFSTTRLGDGWNGTINGKDQSTNTYVYMAEAIDYLGRRIVKKGTVVLIR